MQAWMWGALGLVCLGIETLNIGSFVFVFFSVAAFSVATFVAWGGAGAWLAQSVVFVAVAAGTMVLFRSRLRRHSNSFELRSAAPPSFVEMATAAERIEPGQVGQVELRGTVWRGRNVGTTPLQVGQSYWVVRIDNLTVVLMDRGPHGELQ